METVTVDRRKNVAGRRPPQGAGFTLVEVMIGVLLAMVGLLGTVAVQQTMMNAAIHADDSAIASRLAVQEMEQLNARQLAPVGGPNPGDPLDQLEPVLTNGWFQVGFYNRAGQRQNNWSADSRFLVERRVEDPMGDRNYLVSVRVRYRVGDLEKVIQLDNERRRPW